MKKSSLRLIQAIVLSLAVTHVLTAIPPLFPTNEKELKSTLDDISYSVNKITSPDFKVNPTFWNRFVRALDAPSVPQPDQPPGPPSFSALLGNIGKLMLNFVRWTVDLIKTFKQNKFALLNNATIVGDNPLMADKVNVSLIATNTTTVTETSIN